MAGSLENKGQLPGGLGTLCKIGANLEHKGPEMCVFTLISFSASHFLFFFGYISLRMNMSYAHLEIFKNLFILVIKYN